MIQIRKSLERGYVDHGWLKSYHSFSFASYQDPQFMGWGNLRVINEDRIEPGRGFGTHGHQNMEIVSYVMSGALAHKDNMGNVKTIVPKDVQKMSAGSGVMHSEYNFSATDETHFLQIWILPNVVGIKPQYEQKTFPTATQSGGLSLVASSDGSNGSVHLNADAKIYVGLFEGEQKASLALDPLRKAYVQLIKGELNVNGHRLSSGDALMMEHEPFITINQGRQAEVMVFDLASLPHN